jgi:hypothetical protein
MLDQQFGSHQDLTYDYWWPRLSIYCTNSLHLLIDNEDLVVIWRCTQDGVFTVIAVSAMLSKPGFLPLVVARPSRHYLLCVEALLSGML